MISVLLVDDHEVVRSGYRRLLEGTEDIQVVGEAGSGQDAYRAYVDTLPDVVVMDLHMTPVDGLSATRRILNRNPDARVLIFSMHESEVFLNRALLAGACGYITKRNAASVMIEAVRQVATGEQYVSLDLRPVLNEGEMHQKQPTDVLSPREFEVFLLLAQGVSIKDIAQQIHINEKTAGHHLTRIKDKLNLNNAAELARMAIRHGLVEL